MMRQTEVQYISDAEGKEIGVIVPIDLWYEIKSDSCLPLSLLKLVLPNDRCLPRQL